MLIAVGKMLKKLDTSKVVDIFSQDGTQVKLRTVYERFNFSDSSFWITVDLTLYIQFDFLI